MESPEDFFSNESGLGSAPIAAAAAQTRNPVRQALVSSTGTFWDTVVVCLMTGLVLVTSIMKNPSIDMSNITDEESLPLWHFSRFRYWAPLSWLWELFPLRIQPFSGGPITERGVWNILPEKRD